jgi:hypothetical protein
MRRIHIQKIQRVVESQSRPYVLMGSDMEIYYCKFGIGNCDHTDLFYELISKKAGDALEVPIPEACLLDYRPEQFIDEFPALAIPLVGFGSKEIHPNHILAAKTDFIKNKHDFNRIPNPDDLIRIGIFDLYFMNMDRNDANFNLIQNKGQRDPMKIFAIDHVQCFGGNA